MTVKLRKRVLKRWLELSQETYKVRLEMLLSSRLEPREATAVLSGSLGRVLDAFEHEHPFQPGVEEPFVGEWDIVEVPEGALLIGGYKCDAFEELLHRIVEDLDGQGVSGTLDVHRLPEVPDVPEGIGVIEGRVRVVGRRVANGRDRWAAERAELDRVLAAAVRWCLEVRPDRGVVMNHGATPPLFIRRCDSAVQRVRDVLGDHSWVTVRSIGEERFRSTTVEPNEGRVTVVEGGPALHRRGWEPSVEAITRFLTLVSADSVYALVRRLHRLTAAELVHRDPADWLQRSWIDAIPHEEHLAPDAYGIQLLGPRYAERMPTDDDWRATELPGGRFLLEHVDLASWFAPLTLEEALSGESFPRRALIETARAAFEPILFRDIAREERDERRRNQRGTVAHPWVSLPDRIVAKVHALPRQPWVGHWDVALAMKDGSVVEDVALGHSGATVERIAGEVDFSLDTEAVVDVLDRSPRP
jgi:hypothetical protein